MDKISITTPEQIELDYELAGIGSRFLALFIDHSIQVIVLFSLVLVMLMNYPEIYEGHFYGIFHSTFAGIVLILMFLVIFGYFIFFETIWTGLTPGKKIVQIQVMKDNGEPVSFTDSLLRNLFRIVDFLPGNYLTGALCMIINRRNKRVGDVVAGTIVVRVKAGQVPLVLPDLPAEPGFNLDVTRLTEEEYLLVRNFLIRRDKLGSEERARIASKIATLIRKKTFSEDVDVYDEELLEGAASAYRNFRRSL